MLEPTEDWLMSILYQANRNDTDTYRVFLTMRRYIYDTRDFVGMIEQITPTDIRFKPTTDLADDCFFSVSMFAKHIDRRAVRRGSPSSGFYSKVGRNAFVQIGYPGIAKNWRFWVSYIQERICI